MTFPNLSDDAGAVFDRFDIPYQPAVVVVAPDGEVQTLLGAADDAQLDTLVEQALS